MARCRVCDGESIWYKERLIYPAVVTAPEPHPDLPADEGMRDDYQEARAIVPASPRGACALLRLVVQNLCKYLGEPGKNINADIGALVQKGLPVQVQQALDVVRVVGNNAVHPLELDLRDDQATAGVLFELVNFIVENRISQPAKLQALYDALPQGALDSIARRDGAAPVQGPS